MFRSFFRVVVVAVVMLSFTLSLAQAGQVGAKDARNPVVQVVSGGWVGAVVQWLTELVASKPATGHTRPVHRKGSCIDPWGRDMPCP
jgi:hypothetical protein